MAHAHKHFGAEKVVTGETPHASSDMNVTPLIDVLLVLLIIFMAALPLTQKGVDINLPLETKAPTTPIGQPADRARVQRRSDDGREQAAGDASRSSRTVSARCSRRAGKRRCSSSATRRCDTAKSSPSSTRPRAPGSRRSASSPKACAEAKAPTAHPAATTTDIGSGVALPRHPDGL